MCASQTQFVIVGELVQRMVTESPRRVTIFARNSQSLLPSISRTAGVSVSSPLKMRSRGTFALGPNFPAMDTSKGGLGEASGPAKIPSHRFSSNPYPRLVVAFRAQTNVTGERSAAATSKTLAGITLRIIPPHITPKQGLPIFVTFPFQPSMLKFSPYSLASFTSPPAPIPLFSRSQGRCSCRARSSSETRRARCI